MVLVEGGNGSCPDARRCECGVVRLDSGRTCDAHDRLVASIERIEHEVKRLADLQLSYHAEVTQWRAETAAVTLRVAALEIGGIVVPLPTNGKDRVP